MRQRTETGRASEKRGRAAELFALALLVCKGYRILGRRVKTRLGEIDLIARTPSGIVCFVEVKARPDQGLATDAIGPRQRGRIARAASLWLAGRPEPARFDVVTVLPGHLPRHFKDAWRPEDCR
jgi:Predicted endonuclease distantly related to archaeal Holliday junction resolvase